MTKDSVSPSATLRQLVMAEKNGLLLAVMVACAGVLVELLPWYLLWLAVSVVTAGGSLFTLAGWLLLALVLKYLLLSLAGYFSHKAAFRVLYRTRLRIAHRLAILPLIQLAPYRAGQLRKIVFNDVQRLEDFIAHHCVDLVAAVVAPLVAALFLLAVDWRMALAALLTVPVAVLAQKLCLRNMAARTQEYHQASGRLNAAIIEYVRGMPVMKAFSQSARSFRLLDDSLGDYYRLIARFTRTAVPGWSLFVVLLNANIFILLPLGLWLLSHGQLSLPALVLCLMLGSGLLKPLLRLTFFGSLLREMLDGVSRMQPFLAPEPEPVSGAEPQGSALQVQDLRFSWGDRQVLHPLTLSLEPGGFYALVGPSGAGKSTLAWLLAGLLAPTQGSITLGGVPLATLSDAQRAASLALVSQETFLFQGTLADNLRLARPEASDQQLWQVLEIAQGRAFVAALPQGLQTPIGEQGARLSGGEQQRIAIARALLADTPLLILDEATAFADVLTEAAFYRALRQARPATTVLTIAHRLFAVQQADCLLVMDEGRLSGSGTHARLLQDHALYQRLWHSQSQLARWHIRQQGEVSDAQSIV